MQISEQRLVTRRETIKACICVVTFASLLLSAEDFQWDWHHSEALPPKQALRHAKVTAIEQAAIARAIAQQLKPDMGAGGLSDQDLEDIALDAPVKLVDLNSDGTAEVIAQGTPGDGGCSPTGNCRFWILQKSGQEYKLLFFAEAVQSFNLQASRSNGFSDIAIKTRSSPTESTLRLLRYSEGKYQEAGCYDAHWSEKEGGTIHALKEPRLTPCSSKP